MSKEILASLIEKGTVEIEIIRTKLADAKQLQVSGNQYLVDTFGTLERAKEILSKLEGCMVQAEVDEVVATVPNWNVSLAKGIENKLRKEGNDYTRTQLNFDYPLWMARYAVNSTQSTEVALEGIVKSVVKDALLDTNDLDTALELFAL